MVGVKVGGGVWLGVGVIDGVSVGNGVDAIVGVSVGRSTIVIAGGGSVGSSTAAASSAAESSFSVWFADSWFELQLVIKIKMSKIATSWIGLLLICIGDICSACLKMKRWRRIIDYGPSRFRRLAALLN